MKWICLVIFLAGSGVSTQSIQFPDQASCQNFGKRVMQHVKIQNDKSRYYIIEAVYSCSPSK